MIRAASGSTRKTVHHASRFLYVARTSCSLNVGRCAGVPARGWAADESASLGAYCTSDHRTGAGESSCGGFRTSWGPGELWALVSRRPSILPATSTTSLRGSSSVMTAAYGDGPAG